MMAAVGGQTCPRRRSAPTPRLTSPHPSSTFFYMTSRQTQISAFISDSTKDALERYADAHGLKKAYIIEEALLHHLQALRELPLDVIIPARLVVSRESGQAMLDRVEKPRRPTKAMRELFAK